MKKMILIACAIFILAGTFAFAEGEDQTLFTNGVYNGRFISLVEEGKMSEPAIGFYIYGILDCLWDIDAKAMEKAYPNRTKKEIVKAVFDYYRANPAQRDRPIINLILAGCK